MKCEIPFSGPCSIREPLPIQTPKETDRTYGIASVTIRIPLGNVARSISRTVGDARTMGYPPFSVYRDTLTLDAANTWSRALIGMELYRTQDLLGPGQPTYRARQLYDALYRQQVANLSEISTLPQALRNQLLTRISVGLPAVERRFDSLDGTRRYLLRLRRQPYRGSSTDAGRGGTRSAFRARSGARSIANSA